MHCGFCLPTCPTYALWGEEMDSPRGRIYLMEMAKKGEIPLEGAFTTHIDRCLGCMACVTACPSGVQYDRLLEATRPQIERHVTRTRADRWFREAIFTLFPYKRRLRAASIGGALYQKLRPKSMDRLMARVPERFERLVAMESLLPPVSRARRLRPHAPRAPPRSGRAGAGSACSPAACRTSSSTPSTRPPCGCSPPRAGTSSPRASRRAAGRWACTRVARRRPTERAKKLIAVFERAEVDTIATNVAGCGSSMKEYGELLADDPEWAERASAFAAKVRDISEIVDETLADPRARRHPIEAKVVYHDACHLGHAQKIRTEPRRVLRAIPGVELTELPESEICCGSAGIYNMLQPEAAGDLGRRKADNIRGTGADVLVTANPGCLLQIRKYLDGELPMLHPIQLIDASIRGVRPPEMG